MKRFLPALVLFALLGVSGAAHAALRCTAKATSGGSQQSSITIDVSSCGIQANDIVVILLTGLQAPATWTLPSGFSAIPGGTNSVDVNGSVECAIGYKVAGSSEPSSYTATYSLSQYLNGEIRVYSGRNTTTPFTAEAVTAGTTLGSTSPATAAMTGVTAASGDDVVVYTCFKATNHSTGDTYTVAAPSGFSNAITNYYDLTHWPIDGSYDEQDVASGATGSLDGTLTFSGTSPGYYGGFVISLAAGSTSPRTDNMLMRAYPEKPVIQLPGSVVHLPDNPYSAAAHGRVSSLARLALAANPEAPDGKRLILPPWRR